MSQMQQSFLVIQNAANLQSEQNEEYAEYYHAEQKEEYQVFFVGFLSTLYFLLKMEGKEA